jgi:DNA-binding transcriptional MocR family regulator
MTIWLPNLEQLAGPRYLAIAEALAADIRTGRLKTGERLPTHRDLAYRIGVTVGTVTRAYAEAERRGLIAGEVGRGTYVRDIRAAAIGFPLRESYPLREFDAADATAPIDLSVNYPARQATDELFGDALKTLADEPGVADLLDYQVNRGLLRHRTAGAKLIRRGGLEVPADRVIVTCGAQHAMMVAFAALTRPGDVVLTEALTYPGMKLIAGMLQLRLYGVAMDEHGLKPDAFEAACRTMQPKALYCMPTLQNPTSVTMPESRRREIARIAEALGVAIVEDDIYGFLDPDAPPPVSQFAPSVGHYVLSVSKCLAPGLRAGFLAVPPGDTAAYAAAVRTTIWMAPPLAVEIAARWIVDGTGERLATKLSQEALVRQRMVQERMSGFDYATAPHSMHGWLTLPEPWRASQFAAEARERDVLVTPAEAFVVARPAPQAVRICTGAVRTREQLARGLDILVGLLRSAPEEHLSIM